MGKPGAAAVLVFLFIFSGCATKGGLHGDTKSLEQSKSVKTVSVATFSCPDPEIENDVRNKIIEALLSHYSVTVGQNADVVINGAINLTRVKGPSPSASGNIVSDITARIIKGNKIIDSVTITQDRAGPGFPLSAEAMGQRAGEQIRERLGR